MSSDPDSYEPWHVRTESSLARIEVCFRVAVGHEKYAQIETDVGDVWKRMAGIHGQRCQCRKHPFVVILIQLATLFLA